MSTFELPVVQRAPSSTDSSTPRSAAWLRTARQAKLLAWASRDTCCTPIPRLGATTAAPSRLPDCTDDCCT
jgi:hypothetical protein